VPRRNNKKFKMGTYHCGSAAAPTVAPSGRGNLHIDTWNATDPLSQRPPDEKNPLRWGPSTPDLYKSPVHLLR
ncbi:hypothetical protein AVEN_190477-1, partial [Araneus ventricosus]